MLIMGIDPSLRGTGIVVMNEKSDVVYKHCICFKSGMSRYICLKNIFTILNMIYQKYEPKYFFIEDYSYGSTGALTSQGEVIGVIYSFLFNKVFTVHGMFDEFVHFVGIGKVKKYVTGKGVGKKDLIMKEVYKKFRFDTDNDNIADAFVIAKIGIDSLYLINNKKFPPEMKKYQKDIFKEFSLTKEIYKQIKGKK